MTGTWNLEEISFLPVLQLVTNLLERAVAKRRLTTLRTALVQQEQVSQEEMVLQVRHMGSPSLQEEHNFDILSPQVSSLK